MNEPRPEVLQAGALARERHRQVLDQLAAYDQRAAGEAHVDEHLASNQEAAGSNPVTRSDRDIIRDALTAVTPSLYQRLGDVEWVYEDARSITLGDMYSGSVRFEFDSDGRLSWFDPQSAWEDTDQ